ncbi:MAG: hypothetical protein E7400_03285 [Ruminococcaceae bacterium]|nr:hypothetical protein [Oscillospiraceae bacterium]
MNEAKIEKILSDATEIIRKHEESKFNNGEQFNVLEIAGISTDEVKICKILAEILNPNGTHCLGNLFLKTFAEFILHLELGENELSQAKVYTEYPTYESRRIDIVVQTPERFVPIEVKIYATDQVAQCSDYYKYAKSMHKKHLSKVYYLTLDGHLPQKGGTKGLTPIKEDDALIGYEEIIPISFEKDICRWIDICLADNKVKDRTLIYANLIQFKKALEGLNGNMNNELKDDIKHLISKDSESIKAAHSVAESVAEAKTDLLMKLFKTLESNIASELPELEQLNNEYDYKADNYSMINSYFQTKASTHPSLIYKFKTIDEDRDIWFAIEVDYKLFCGFGVTYGGEITDEKTTTKEELKEHIKLAHYDEGGWWFYWEYLPTHDKQGTYTPDFKANNEVFFKLFDDAYFEDFIKNSLIQIKKIVDEAKNIK